MKFRHRKYRPALPHVVQRDTTGVVGLMPKMNASESPQKRERERERERVRERERRGRERESQREREGERERESERERGKKTHIITFTLPLWQFERTSRNVPARHSKR